jgi:hypothetical protein
MLLLEESKDFWNSIGVSYNHITGVSNKKLGSSIKTNIESNPDEISILKNLFKDQDITIDKDDLQEKSKDLAKKDEAIIVYALHEYQTNKRVFLNDYFDKISDKFNFTNKNNILISLIELYVADELDLIRDSFHYCIFSKSKTLKKWISKTDLSRTFINDFNEFERRLILMAHKRLNHKVKLKYSFNIKNIYYYSYYKAKKDEVISGYDENKEIKKREVFILKIDLDKNILHIKSRNPRVSEIFLKVFDLLNISLYDIKSLSENKDVSSKVASILENSSGLSDLEEVSLNRLNSEIKNKIKIKKLKYDTPINKIILKLKESELIDTTNFHILDYFVINIDNFLVKINVEKNDDFVRFEIGAEKFTEEKKQLIYKYFENTFNLSLGIDYFSTEIGKEEKQTILSNIIGKRPSDLSPKERVVYSEIFDFEIFDSEIIPIYRCRSSFFHDIPLGESEKCPHCGSNLVARPPIERIKISDNKLLNYLEHKLSSVYGEHAIERIKINKDDKEVILMKTPKTEIILYPYLKGSILPELKKWNKDKIPTIQVVVDKEIKENKELNLTSKIYLYNLLFDSDDQIKQNVDIISIHKYEELITNEINQSIAILKEIISGKKLGDLMQGPKGDNFEKVVYPLIEKMFYNIVHWGRSKKFETVPDGAMGIKLNSTKSQAFSMIYDFKYSDSSYTLEKRQVLNYIQRANKDDNIKKFSNKLSAFLAIAHNLSEDVYKNTTDDYILISDSSKNTKMIHVNIENILYLFDLFQKKYILFDEFKPAFNLAFANFIKKNQEKTIFLKQNEINQIINNALQIKGSLNLDNFYEFMKSNKSP